MENIGQGFLFRTLALGHAPQTYGQSEISSKLVERGCGNIKLINMHHTQLSLTSCFFNGPLL